jgi:hypothetical protein
MAAAVAAPALAQSSSGVRVIVNGQQMNFDQPPLEQGGRVFVPLRGVFEQLGASVVYQNGTINATGRGRTIQLHIGSNQAEVNGSNETLDSPPFVQGSRTLVPLRFVAEALGAQVAWDNNTSTVTITGGGGGGGGGDRGHMMNQPPMQQQPMAPNAYIVDRQPQGPTDSADPAISARFTVPLRRDSVRIYLDGRDITSAVDFNDRGFQWTPGHRLEPGSHHVRISGTTRDGASFDTGWDFRI